MLLKVHFHSDCQFFSGSENMIVNFLSSNEMRDNFDISFSYRDSTEYTNGFLRRVKVDFPVYALKLSNPARMVSYPFHLPQKISRLVNVMLKMLTKPILFFYDLYVLINLFRRIKPGLLHINNGGFPGAASCRLAALAAKICGIDSVVMVVNNQAYPYDSIRRLLNYPVDRLVVFSVNKFITGSISAAERLKCVLSLPENKVTSIYNGILLRSTDEENNKTKQRLGIKSFNGVVFGVVALMEKRKGHIVLLNSIQKLLQKDPLLAYKMKFLLEGDGPLLEELEIYVKKNSLDSVVHFIGNESNIVNFMSVMDVIVLPSIYGEDFPNVILEAMALGKPVIASRVAGTPEQVINEVSGILVTPSDSSELADALLIMLKNFKKRMAMGSKGLEIFNEKFKASISVSKYINLYKNMTGGVI